MNKIGVYNNTLSQSARSLLVCIVILFSYTGYAQTIFKGILVNKIDSSVIPYAAVNAKETGESVLTDDKGAFQLTIPKAARQITLNISAINSKATVVYKYPFTNIEYIYVDVFANTLNEFSLKGFSAEEIVKMAVAAIPANYADSSYFDYSFYRRYQEVNGAFVNLFEAYPAVMFRLLKNNNRIVAQEAFAVNQLRRSAFHPDIMNAMEDNPVDLLTQNPVYHLEASSLNPSKFPNYQFSFDTVNKSDDYVIHYVCNNFSTDIHGVGDYEYRDLRGEAWEMGELTIDRESFAIKKFYRRSFRHKDYVYKFKIPNNLEIYYNHKYFFEFTGGDLQVEYAPRNGKWYPKKIFRQYTNEFYIPVFNTREYVITDNFEWYSDSISRYTTGDYAGKFYSKLATAIHAYDPSFWIRDDFPFYYADKDEIYKGLERDGPVEKQFYNETKIDEYKKKPSKK